MPKAVERVGAMSHEITCGQCHQGTLVLVGRPGRVVQLDGVVVAVPRDFLIPTCDQCGAETIDPAREAALAAAIATARLSGLRSAYTDKMSALDVAPAPAGAADAAAAAHDDAAALAVGEVVDGAYEIVKLLGSGATGTIYEAFDRGLDRRVLVKLGGAASEHALRTEAHALAAVAHPALPAVHALGRDRGLSFAVLELVRGTTLRSHIQKYARTSTQLTIREVLDLLLGVAEGLAALHVAGLAHRDLKPAHIVLAPGGRTVLTELGSFTPERERRRSAAGAPEYVAPEIYAASADAVAGHLVDLYAFGVICFELITGRPPYRGVDALETLAMHLHQPIPDLAAERPGVPGELTALVVELLSKEPGARPQSSDEVVERLRAARARLLRARARDHFSVLIVDDDRDFAETVRAIVRAAIPDANVNVALDGEAALVSLSKQVPTLMLLDLNMPRMNGLELCMTLRRSGLAAECEIISVNGAVTAKDRQLLQHLGVRQTLTKTPTVSRTIVDLVKTSKRRWLSAAFS